MSAFVGMGSQPREALFTGFTRGPIDACVYVDDQEVFVASDAEAAIRHRISLGYTARAKVLALVGRRVYQAIFVSRQRPAKWGDPKYWRWRLLRQRGPKS